MLPVFDPLELMTIINCFGFLVVFALDCVVSETVSQLKKLVDSDCVKMV